MKIGLEKEFFLVNKEGEPQIIPQGISMDECGVLAEARGLPFDNGIDAVYSLKASIHKLDVAVSKLEGGMKLVDVPYMKIPRNTQLALTRLYVKPIRKEHNLYGYEIHRNAFSVQTAGIHVSFTDEGRYHKTIDDPEFVFNRMFDFPTIFRAFDKKFEKEIKDSKRCPGFYEIKEDGRVEYRSLPANVKLDDIANFLSTL